MIRPRFLRAALPCAAAFAASAAAVAGPLLQPQDFAYGMEVTTPRQAAAYRLALPLQVYRGCTRTDLGDLRVFNARGETVPHALRRPRIAAAPPQTLQSMPLFALRGEPDAALAAVRVTIESGRGTVNLRAQDAGTKREEEVIATYIVDGRTLGQPVSGLQVKWPQQAPEFAGHLRVEAGDRLDRWRPVGGGTVANLRAGDSSLIERDVAIQTTRARFWRLSWSGRPAPFEITGVLLRPAGTPVESRRDSLSVPGVQRPDEPMEFIFDLGAGLPVDRLNIALPEPNSIVRIALSSRADTQAQWQPVTTHGFYRLLQPAGETAAELRNKPVTIGTRPHRYWRARIDGDESGMDIGGGALRLSVEWIAHELVFVARGTGPFTVAYGSGEAAAARTAFDTIPGGIDIATAEPGPSQQLGGPARLQPPPAPLPWKSWLLWAALAIGVALLAWMALRLSKELGHRDT